MLKVPAILLVEDNPDHEALALRALRKNGFGESVAVARDGVEALDYLFGRGAHSRPLNDTALPGLVLLDLKLPRVDGLEVLRQMRSHELTRWLPTVVLSSSDEELDMVTAYACGANSYVPKPIDYGQFVEAINQISRYWLSVNRSPRGR